MLGNIKADQISSPFGFEPQIHAHRLKAAGTPIDTAQRCYVAIIASHCNSYVTPVGPATMSWIESNPSLVWQLRFEPGMACLRSSGGLVC